MRKVLRAIDAFNEKAGSISSWLIVILVVVILIEVISRYVFNAPTRWAFGSFRMLGGGIVVLGWAYAQRHNSHIRMDIIYNRFTVRTRAIIDVFGTGLFFFPLFTYFIIRIANSLWGRILAGQILSPNTGGAPPSAMLYNIIVLIGLLLFFLQFTAQFTRDLYTMAKGTTL
jgi:TRAP-type mannitol/chloroaromatic compound transport system permease small subunit